jgi:hypothetical protein
MNRAARRAAAAKQRRHAQNNAAPPSLDRPRLLRLAAELVENDTSISGATLILPDGSITYLDAGAIHRAGRA